MKKYFVAGVVIAVLLPVFVFAQTASFNTNLYYGITGSTDVSALQEFLTQQGAYHGPTSGNFFSLTLSGVKTFQKAEGITPVSGYVGPVTRGVINKILAGQVSSSEGNATTTQAPVDLSQQTNQATTTYTPNIPQSVTYLCPTGDSGTYPNCIAPQCPQFYTGTYPNCVALQCPSGYTGTYPSCVAPTQTTMQCPAGETGTYPNCTTTAVVSQIPAPTCELTAATTPYSYATDSLTIGWTTQNANTGTLSGDYLLFSNPLATQPIHDYSIQNSTAENATAESIPTLALPPSPALGGGNCNASNTSIANGITYCGGAVSGGATINSGYYRDLSLQQTTWPLLQQLTGW